MALAKISCRMMPSVPCIGGRDTELSSPLFGRVNQDADSRSDFDRGVANSSAPEYIVEGNWSTLYSSVCRAVTGLLVAKCLTESS
jgi:hypothetical protein